MRPVATTDQGLLSEQRVRLAAPEGGASLQLRRIRLELSTPTRAGETTRYLLTTLPATSADAAVVATRYRERWTLETAFLQLIYSGPEI
jgi:hypothetical protein